MTLRLVYLALLLSIWSCSSSPSSETTTDNLPIESMVEAIDQEIAGIAKDKSCEYISQPLNDIDGKQLSACLRKSDLVMIEEEEINSQQAKINRYYYKDNQLVFAAEYIVNPCADTLDVCVNETRCYFQKDKMICEYVRSVSIPLNENGWLDEGNWEEYLSRMDYEKQQIDPNKAPVLLKRSANLRSNFDDEINNEG